MAQSYDALNIVALNGSSFIARWNDPGECPGDGWQLIASCGRAGKPGPKGERGEQGPRGLPGPSLVRGEIDRKTYTMKLIMSDGSEVQLHCRGFFEQYHEESDG
ncbi:collagen-like protein [Bradyrhizobium sp. CCGUVB1N3]|uniref:collagen-like protein n=1 Tax=Bradyrhizobium sp. CCGUVB1N3 TaxID=2949629 RepID=UPI0020B39784|nr:collagen-like protein [Bradyrhizobium sp. CCGUVB1N3]MCP3475139.1 collagen-like protein [Bradyrhizobium sp. CCGUVB1N3]